MAMVKDGELVKLFNLENEEEEKEMRSEFLKALETKSPTDFLTAETKQALDAKIKALQDAMNKDE